MSRRNPIATHNVIIGLDTSGMKDRFADVLNPELGKIGLAAPTGRTPATSVTKFAEELSTLAKEEDSIFAASNDNLLTFEHTFNFDGQNSEPKFKVKLIDVNDNLITQFLKFGVTSAPPSSPPGGAASVPPSSPPGGVAAGAPIFKPKITPVWIAYGTGNDPTGWVGPMDGYLTDIQLSYDANLLRTYDLTITSLPISGKHSTNIGSGARFKWRVSFLSDALQENKFQRELEKLLRAYIRSNLGSDVQPIIILPDINYQLNKLRGPLASALNRYMEEVVSKNPFESYYYVDYEQEVMRDICSALGFVSGETTAPVAAGETPLNRFGYPYPGRNADGTLNWGGKSHWATNKQEQVDLLGPVKTGNDFPGVNINREYKEGSDFNDEIRKRQYRKSYNDIATESPSLAYLTNSPAKLGLTMRWESAGSKLGPWSEHKQMTLALADDPENSDPVEFFHKFLRNLDNLIGTYKINGIVTYETNNTLKRYWEKEGIINDATKPVFIAGDLQLISNYLYADLYVYKTLRNQIIVAKEENLASTGSAGDDVDKVFDKTLKLIEKGLKHTESIKLPTNTMYPKTWKAVVDDTYQFAVQTILNPNPVGVDTKDFEGVGFAGTTDFVTMAAQKEMELAINNVVHEFRAGYPDSNILSFEQDISKYLLANLFKVAKTAAEKDFFS